MNKSKLVAIVLIAILGFACYFNSLSAPFIWDDIALVKNNFLIRDTRYIGRIFLTELFNLGSEGSSFYRPLQSISYMLDYHIWGLNPLGYRLTNIILQILTAILLYQFILIISQDRVISLITALLFVVHPMHVEAVTYISGRADLLLGLFLLLSLILFIRGFYLLCLISFICVLLSKELALIFPLLPILYVFGYNFAVSRRNPPRPYVYLSFFLTSVIYLYLRFNMFPGRTIFPSPDNLYISILFFFKAIFLYLKTLVLPLNLHMSRTVAPPASINEPLIILSILGVVCFFLVIVKTSARCAKFGHSRSKGETSLRIFSFGLSWFILFLFPYSGIFQINAYFSEHFCYLSSMGIFLVMAVMSARLIKKKKIFIFLPSVFIIFYGCLTVKYNFVWHDPEGFYRRILKFSQGSFAACNNLAAIEEAKENYDAAEEYYLKALNIKPDFDQALLNLLRIIYLSGREDAALNQLKDFVRRRPDSSWGWANLGSMYANSRQYPEAIGAYRQSLLINPSIPKHHYFLALILREAGDLDSAIRELNSAIALDSENYTYHNDLGVLYKDKGLFNLAVKEYLFAFKLAPESPAISLNLGIVYALLGESDKAEYYLSNSVRLDDNSMLAHYNLGLFYWQREQYDKAGAEFESALKISPGFKPAKEMIF